MLYIERIIDIHKHTKYNQHQKRGSQECGQNIDYNKKEN